MVKIFNQIKRRVSRVTSRDDDEPRQSKASPSDLTPSGSARIGYDRPIGPAPMSPASPSDLRGGSSGGGGGGGGSSRPQSIASPSDLQPQRPQTPSTPPQTKAPQVDIASQLKNQGKQNQVQTSFGTFDEQAGPGPQGVFLARSSEIAGIRRAGRGAVEIAPATSPRDLISATDRGVFLSQFTNQAPSPLGIFGPTFEERERERATARTAERSLKFVESTQRQFREDPESFVGRPGVVGQSTAQGTQISLTSDFFSPEFTRIREESIAETRGETARQFNRPLRDIFRGTAASSELLPVSTRAGALTSSGLSAFGSTAVRTAEFGVGITATLGRQTLEPEQDLIGFRDFRFGSGTTLGQISRSPTTRISSTSFTESPVRSVTERIGPQAFLIGGLGAAATARGTGQFLRTRREIGTFPAIVESAQIFSPLSIRSGVFVPDVSRESFRGGTITSGSNRAFNRIGVFEGASGDSVIITRQSGRISSSGAESIDTQRSILFQSALEIRGGGAFSRFGIRRSTFEGIGLSEAGTGTFAPQGPISFTQEFKGGLGQVAGRTTQQELFLPRSGGLRARREVTVFPTSSTLQVFRGGGVTLGRSEEIPAISRFTTGPRRGLTEPVLDIASPIRGFRQTGNFRITPRVSGVDIDLTRGISGLGGSGFSIGRGRPRSPGLGLQEPASPSLINQEGLVRGVTQTPRVRPNTNQFRTVNAPLQSNLNLQSSNLQSNIQTTIPSPRTRLSSRERTSNLNLQGSSTGLAQGSRQRERLLQPSLSNTRVASAVGFGAATRLGGRTLQRQLTTPGSTTTFTPSFTTFPPFTGGGFGTPFAPPPLPSFRDRTGRRKGRRSRQPLGFQPSFTALQLGIRGRQPTETAIGFTPFQLRVIPNGRRTRKRKSRKK